MVEAIREEAVHEPQEEAPGGVRQVEGRGSRAEGACVGEGQPTMSTCALLVFAILSASLPDDFLLLF